MSLTSTLPLNQNLTFFANNYFTSLPHASKLKEMLIFYEGTICKSQLENRLLNEEKELKKKGRG